MPDTSQVPPQPSGPYADQSQNDMYNLMFADDSDAFRGAAQGRLAPLFEPSATSGQLLEIATDPGVASRLRVIAFRRLRAAEPTDSSAATALPLLGVIVEIGLEGGTDTLAAYSDGGVRYLNHAGPMVIVDDGRVFAREVGALLGAAGPLVAAIGPWTGARLPSVGAGVARLSFLVGDQLYFGQGPIDALATDARGGPVLAAATTLVGAVMQRAAAGPA